MISVFILMRNQEAPFKAVQKRTAFIRLLPYCGFFRKLWSKQAVRKKGVAMPLIQVVVALIVVGVLLWLVNLIPMQGTIKSILNTVVVIFVVIWLLNVFGFMPYLSHVRVGNYRL